MRPGHIIIVVFALWTTCLAAQNVPAYTSVPVTDNAGLLSADQAAALSDTLTALKQDTGIDMRVVSLRTQANYAPEISFEAFSTAIFDRWGIGDATRNDGILVLLIPNDRVMRIELGKGYGQQTEKNWDGVAAQIIDRSFIPPFMTGNFPKGIEMGVDDIIKTIAIPFYAASPEAKNSGINKGLLGFLVISGVILVVAFRQRLSDTAVRLKPCPKCGKRGLHRERTVHATPTKIAPGKGGLETRCSHCFYKDHSLYVIPKRAALSGSGRFGGGSSSGGGASGHW